jgi:uncharacterized protein YaaN involved in tellurite resistance
VADKPKLSINFTQDTQSKVAPIPPAPVSRTEGILSEEMDKKPDGGRKFFAYKLLDEDSIAEARKVTLSLYPQMFNDPVFTMTFGEEAVDAMNALVDRKEKEEQSVDIPALYRIMRHASEVMLGLKERYNLSDEEVREQVEKAVRGEKSLFASLFGKGEITLQNLRLDLQSVEQQVDAMDAEMLKEQSKLLHNISLQHELYNATEDEILELVRVIALMELVRENAQQEADSIKADPSDLAQRNEIERRRRIVDFMFILDSKITEYTNRMFLAWTSSREIMNDRTLYVGLATKLQHQMKLTVPAMKSAMLRWAKRIEAMQSSQVIDVASALANEWFVAAADSSANTMEQIANSAYSSTIKEETLDQVSASVAREAEALLKAYEQTGEQRAGINRALVRAQQLMQQKDQEINEEVIRQMAEEAATRLTADVSTDLPEMNVHQTQEEEVRSKRLSR